MHANVGPKRLPGKARSDTPPDHKSISCGDLKRENREQKNHITESELLKICINIERSDTSLDFSNVTQGIKC